MLGAALHFLIAHEPHVLANLGLSAPTPVDTVEGLRDHDPHLGLNPSVYALIVGIVSGLSLPIGAAAGIYLSPVRPHTCALMMAFGAGALLFAVTVELYGHALREVEKERMGVLEMFVIIFGALAGAAFYLTSNQWLKEAFPEEEEHDAETPKTAVSSRSVDASEPLAKAVQEAQRETKKEKEAARLAREELRKEQETSAPLLSALKHSEEKKDKEKNQAVAKAMWAKLRDRQKETSVIRRLLAKKEDFSFDRPREIALKAACEGSEVDRKGLTVALGIFLGLLVDGLPEGILMGFLSAEGHLTPVLIVSLFVANFPEAFASGSLMVQAGLSTTTIIGLWSGLCLLVGSLCGLSCYLLLFFFPAYGVHSAHGGEHGSDLPMSILIGIALVEGVTGGAMISCISSVMLPEAFANCDKNRPFFHQTGFSCAAGFLVSVALKTLFG